MPYCDSFDLSVYYSIVIIISQVAQLYIIIMGNGATGILFIDYFFKFIANAKCIITSDVAMIENKTYYPKETVDRALESINFRKKPRQGSRYGSTKSLDQLAQPEKLGPPMLELQRSVSFSEAENLKEEEENLDSLPIEIKAKPQYIVLVSRRSESGTEDDFTLEEV